MATSTGSQVIVIAFVAACVAGIVCFIWSAIFLVRMGFQISDPKNAFSARTLWNPLNALFSPELLSQAGQRSRRLFFLGLFGFVLSIAAALGVGGLAWVVYKS
jgi:hypothetical protein